MDAPLLRPSKIGIMRDLPVDLLQEHDRDGTIPTNARFLFYELVQRGQLSKERTGARRSDQIVHDALTDLREAGRIPWNWITDETRAVEDYTGYVSIKAGVLARLPYATLTFRPGECRHGANDNEHQHKTRGTGTDSP